MIQPTLYTARLMLRPFVLSDARAVQRLAGDAAVAEMTLNVPHPYPDGAAESWIASHPPAWAERTAVTFAIATLDDELRGTIGLQLVLPHGRGEMGYWIGRPFWGQGLVTEAVGGILAFAFSQLGLNRVQASHLPRNPASGRVMQKAGMQREGLRRESYLKNGRFEDVTAKAGIRVPLARWSLKLRAVFSASRIVTSMSR